MSISEKIIEIISNILNIDKNLITDNINWDNCSEWDSITHIRLILKLESEFNISIQESDVVQMYSVAQIKNIINKLVRDEHN